MQTDLPIAEQLAAARAAGAGPVKAPSLKKVLLVERRLAVAAAGAGRGAACRWLLFTTSGARWVAATVTSRFAPQIEYASLDGTIAGELVVTDFHFDGGADKARISHRSR